MQKPPNQGANGLGRRCSNRCILNCCNCPRVGKHAAVEKRDQGHDTRPLIVRLPGHQVTRQRPHGPAGITANIIHKPVHFAACTKSAIEQPAGDMQINNKINKSRAGKKKEKKRSTAPTHPEPCFELFRLKTLSTAVPSSSPASTKSVTEFGRKKEPAFALPSSPSPNLDTAQPKVRQSARNIEQRDPTFPTAEKAVVEASPPKKKREMRVKMMSHNDVEVIVPLSS